MDYLDKKRIESAFYHPKSKPETRISIVTPIARQAAAEGIVLLKNDRDALPLKKGVKAA